MNYALDRRAFVAGAAALAVPGKAERFDAVVGPEGHRTVQEAINTAPTGLGRPYRILIRNGVWKEKLTLNKPNIHLIGESRAHAELNFDAAAGLPSPDGTAWGTFRSASLAISAPDCALINLRVVNSFDYVTAAANPGASPAGNGLQAVALSVMAGADRTLIDRCTLLGYQDTLLVNAGRTLLTGCEVAGGVDFIFGAGTALFERCRIVSRRAGYVVAPSTLISNPYGLIFDRCRLEKAKGVAKGAVALGRPWRPGTRFPDGQYGNPDAVGQAVFLRCWMDDHIRKPGWDRMAYRAKDGSQAWFEPGQARFFEFGSRGPGAARADSRRVLTRTEAAGYERGKVLGGWSV